MSGSAISFYNGLNLKKKYVYLNGRSFVDSQDVFYIQNPKNKKETLCFTFDENRRLVPLMSYDHFSHCTRTMSVRIIQSDHKRRKTYNPLINKHQQLLSAVEGANNGIKDGVIEDVNKFYSALSAIIAAQDLSKNRFSSKYTLSLDQDQFIRLFQHGHKKVLLGNAPIARQTTSKCLLDFIAEYDSWIDKGLPYQVTTTMANVADFIRDFGLDTTTKDQQEQSDEMLFQQIDEAFGSIAEEPSDELLFQQIDEAFGIAAEEPRDENITNAPITHMFNNRKRQSDQELAQTIRPSAKMAKIRTPSPFPFWSP